MGRRPREPPLRRRRRGARLPGRLRVARGERAPPPAPPRADLRREPQFLLASATIANAGELAQALTGERAPVIDRDTSSRSDRDVVIWNPPLLDPELGLRASPLGDAARLLAQLTSRGLRTICFAKSRKAAELIHRFTAERVDVATAARLARIEPATRPSSGATSSGGSSKAISSASPRPTRSSSGSTSAFSTAQSRSVSPARSPRCGSSGASRAPRPRPGDPGGERTPSTSSSPASRTHSCHAESRLRFSIMRTRASSTRTSSPPRSRRLSTRVTQRRSAPRRFAARPSFPSSSARPQASSGRDATIRPRGSRSVPETRTPSRWSTRRPARSRARRA